MKLPCSANTDALWFANAETAVGREAQAKAARLCQGCPIVAQCAIEALEQGIPHGVWGGLTEQDRWEAWRRQGGKPQGFEVWRDWAREGIRQEQRRTAA